MSDKPKGIQEGPPIWVETLMTIQEWKVHHKTFHTNTPEPVQYDQHYHKGGKWRNGMGSKLVSTEILNINHNIDYLLEQNVAI